MISNRELPAGTVLTAKFKKTTHTCEVLVDGEGKRTYRLPDGKTFTSPSAAGSAVMKGVACNGWRFWTVQGEEPAKTAEPAAKAPRTRTTPAPKPAGKVIQIKRLRKQEGCAEGEEKFFCSACMSGWCGPKGRVPDVCPQGHPREATDELAPPAGESAEASTED